MTKRMKDYSGAKHSNTHVTPDCESVDLLFGLTPKEIYFRIGYYFEYPRIVSVALMDMLEKAQNRNNDSEDFSILVVFTGRVSILTDLDRIEQIYQSFDSYFRYDSGYYESSDYDHPDKEAIEAAEKLHELLMGIICKIEKLGFFDFSTCVTGSISEIKTKQAYEDMMLAFGVIANLYVSYERNRWENQSVICYKKSKSIK